MRRKLTSLLLAAILCLALVQPGYAAAGMENFSAALEYDGRFNDVSPSKWYADNVKAAFEYGLMNGTGEDTFNPNGKLSIAETLVLACRLHSTYYGNGVEFTPGDPWYQCYVDYAVDAGIIREGEYGNYTANATRAQFAVLLAASLPRRALQAINQVTAIPDVPTGAAYYDAVYLLYNAGVLSGSDAYGTFNPTGTITRAEVAAIVTRMADPALRQSVTLSGSGLGNFTRTQEYQGQFTDVPAESWYAENVKAAYELRLMSGTGEDAFNPNGKLTLAETLAIACRLHSIYFGNGGQFQASSPWYQVYVDYARTNNIYRPSGFAYYNGTATRAQFASILAASLPSDALAAINHVVSIPDVSPYASYADAVYLLYNAGVLTGSDEQGSFRPTGSVTRAEVAAIVTRMADPALRQSVVLGEEKPRYRIDDARKLNEYAVQAAQNTADALNACGLSAAGETAQRVQHLNDAIAYAKESMSCLNSAIALMEKRVELELTGDHYATLTELVRAAYGLLDEIDELRADETNVDDVYTSVNSAVGQATVLNSRFEKLSGDLVNAFG